MNPAELVVVGTFPSRIDAELAQSAMDAAGIDAMVSGDDAGGLRPHMALGKVRSRKFEVRSGGCEVARS